MADALDYAPPPPKKEPVPSQIFFSLVALGTISYTIMCYIWYWKTPAPVSSDRTMLVVLTCLSVLQGMFLTLKVYLFLHPPARRARDLLNLYTRIYSAEPEWVAVDPRQVPGTDVRQLERMRKEFEVEGWTLLGDFENAGLRRAEPRTRICCRCVTDGGGECIATMFAGRYRLWVLLLLLLVRKRGGYRACAIETFLSDGMTLTTGFPAGKSGRRHPWVVGHAEPWTVGAGGLIRRHRREVAAYLAGHPGVHVLAAPTRAIWLEHLAASIRRVNQHYNETGYLTPEDLRRMYGEKGNITRQLVPALEQILYEDQRKAQGTKSVLPASR